VASPEGSDAESPRLLSRPGGFWLAWLARKVEEDTNAIEGPGESRAYRWVEVTTLDAYGGSAGPVRRVSSEKGRAVGFELATHDSELVVMVEDEAAQAEGAGARIVRHVVADAHVGSIGLVDGGVGHGLSDLVPVPAGAGLTGPRWLAWTDTSERAHMTPLAPGLLPEAPSTLEPALDGSRVLAAARVGDEGGVFVLVSASPNAAKLGATAHPEIRRFTCR
jgi:hypothetical protein